MKKISILSILLSLIVVLQAEAQKAGEIIVYNSKYYILGENIITNPSFNDGFTGWTAGDGSALTSTNFTLNSSGGSDGGAYIVGKSNKGNTDAGSLATGWSIAANTDYYFSIDIKQTGSGNNTSFLITTLTNGMTSSDNIDSRLYGDGSFNYTPRIGNYSVAAGEWVHNETVFNSVDYTYVQCRFRWLDNQFGFDNFYLAPVTEATTEDLIHAEQNKLIALQQAASLFITDSLSNLKGVADELQAIIDESKAYNSSNDTEEIGIVLATLQEGMERAKEGMDKHDELCSLIAQMLEIAATTDYPGKSAFAESISQANALCTATETSTLKDYNKGISLLNEGFYIYFGEYKIPVNSGIEQGKEYYLYNTYYNRIAGSNASSAAPALSYLGTQSDTASYIWIPEAATDHDGCYTLRQKSSGKYMVCSTANTWSMTFAADKGSATTSLWAFDGGSIRSLYSGKYLGCDAGAESSSYINFYYDKAAGDLSRWEVLESSCKSVDQARLKLYRDRLGAALTAAKTIIANSELYDAQSVNTIEQLLKTYSILYITASGIGDLAQLTLATTEIQRAIETCNMGNGTVWASGSSFAPANSFAVAVGGVQLAENSVAAFIAQNNSGTGFIAIVSSEGIKVGDTLYTLSESDITAHSYHFACSGTKVSVYCDGSLLGESEAAQIGAGGDAQFSVLGEANLTAYMPEVVSSSQGLAPGEQQVNSHGKAERNIIKMVGQSLTLDSPVDLHITTPTGTAPIQSSTIDITHEDAWVIIDNTLPSLLIGSYLNSFKVNGSNAANNSNLRVAIYLNGAALIPHGSSYQAFYGYDQYNREGNETSYAAGTYKNLGKAANTFKSFVLKRGYMVTLASTPDGGANDGNTARSYSRVYVADHEDIVVDEIPEALNQRISFVSLRKWQYNSKKGWAATGSSTAACKQARVGWCYSWSAGYSSAIDYEYVPMKGHLWWPGWDEINGKTTSNHMLLYNEPEHAEQHEAADCSCGGTISEWSAFTNSVNSLSSGMRVGAPAPTDAGYLTNFTGYCDAYHRRCDYVAYHYYGTSLSSLKSTLESIHNKTGRPIWITELEYGDSWGDDPGYTDYSSAAVKVKEMMDMLEGLDYVERYVIYNWDLWYNMLINYDNWLTPAGQVYRDYPSTFAYNASQQFVSPWWRPSVQDVTLGATLNSSTEKITFTVKNPNEDATGKMVILHQTADGLWEEFYSEQERYRYDSENNSYALDYAGLDAGEQLFKLQVTTLYGSTKESGTVTVTVPIGSGIENRTIDGNLRIEKREEAVVITSTTDRQVNIYSTGGKTVARLSLKAGNPQTYYLQKGAYIIDGRKTVINH